MTGHSPRIWDHKRSLQRDAVARAQLRIGQLGILTGTENLSQATDWTIQESHHVMVVHLGGRMDRMDNEFSVGPSGSAIPSRGDVWVIPAGCRYAAQAQGERAQFVQFSVPTAVLGEASLVARVHHRDEFLFAAADCLSDLMTEPDDDIAQMAAHGIGDALQLYLLQRYGARRRAAQGRALNAIDRAMLVEAVHASLDSQISLGSLAAAVGMDTRPFTSAFKAAFGISPWQYVLQARLKEAARLLRDTEIAMTDIALTVGFATPSHFTTAFKKRFGVSPIRYRRSFR